MTETELKNEIKKKSLLGVYFFYGEEDYMKNHSADEVKRTVLEDDQHDRGLGAVGLRQGVGYPAERQLCRETEREG